MYALHGVCMQRREQQEFNLVGTLAATASVHSDRRNLPIATTTSTPPCPCNCPGLPLPPLLPAVHSPVCHTLLSILC